MKKMRKIEGTVADATLPKTPITIDGKTYDLCFDLGALAEAERVINVELMMAKDPRRVNILHAIIEENLTNTRVLFAASLRRFHPEIGFSEALALVRRDTLMEIAVAQHEAYRAAMPDAPRKAQGENQAT